MSNLVPSIDRYILRLTVVPMLGVFALAASLLMLDKMLRLFDFVAVEGGPVAVVFKMLGALIPEYASLAIPLGLLLGVLLAFRKAVLLGEVAEARHRCLWLWDHPNTLAGEAERAALEARMLLAHLEEDAEALARLVAQAELLENPYLVERGRALLAGLRRDPGLLEGLPGFLPALARALLREDPALLPPRPEAREERLYWHAARYRLLREEEDLKALLSLTDARERVLPGLVPLDLLPRKRPELARAYPLEEVLRSGWKEAVALRLAEIPPLRVEVLGSFRVRNPLGGVELKGKAREVLAILLLGLPREEVAFALWPDLSEEAALNNLYVWLNRLRKALEPWGLPTYLGEEGLKHLACDLHALEEALRREDAEAAFALYREPLFPGLDHPLLDRKREEVFHRVRALFLKKGEPRYLERLLELDPLDEEALLPLVERCLARGQRARALAHLERYRRRLWEELGERPSPEVEALLRELGG